MQNPVHVGDQRYISLPALPSIKADYSEEARIAQLEGVVRFIVTGSREVKVKQPLGLGLDENAQLAVEKLVDEAYPPYGEPSVDFVIPDKRSRWHLLAVKFREYEDAERARFTSVVLPEGAGIVGDEAMDHAQVVAALGKTAWAVIAFDIDEHGVPGEFSGISATDAMWIEQAIPFVQRWRFAPAMLDGEPVTTRCVVGLAWGSRSLDVKKIEELQIQLKGALQFSKSPSALR